MTVLSFRGDLTLEGQAIYTEFALEVSREQLASILQALLATGAPVSSSKEIVTSKAETPLACPQAKTPVTANTPAIPIVHQPETDDEFAADYSRFLSPHPGRAISLRDLRKAKSEAELWVLIARRYPWMFEADLTAARPPDSMADIKKLEAGQPLTGPSRLEQDWQIIEPHLDELINDAGEFIYGHQSRIARLLGGKNEGGFRADRVLPIEARIKEQVLPGWGPQEKQPRDWRSTTTSTGPGEVEPGDESNTSTLVA